MKTPDLLDQIVDVLTHLTSSVPNSPEVANQDPATRAREMTMAAASQAGAFAGALALPPGPLGMLTILPDILTVWRIQRQLVADIAASYGKSAELAQETMVYCLFRHAAAQVVRDLAVRVGERLLLGRVSVNVMERSLQRIGMAVTRRTIARTAARWLPVVGALGVGGYAFYDTMQVGRTAQALFERETIEIIPSPS